MRLLLVENEKRMAQALCELLRFEKYEVDHYDNGIDGLAAVESNVLPLTHRKTDLLLMSAICKSAIWGQ